MSIITPSKLLRDLRNTTNYSELIRYGYDPQLLEKQLSYLGYEVKVEGSNARIVKKGEDVEQRN